MNYENHNSIVAAISIFTQQESHILGNPALLHTRSKKQREQEVSTNPNCQNGRNNITLNKLEGKEMTESEYSSNTPLSALCQALR